MARRIHISVLRVGDIPLDKVQAHHARDVLRLPTGTAVDLFDDAGATAVGVLHHLTSGQSHVQIEQVNPRSSLSGIQWTIAAAVPKGDRADWMVEKLSELGAAAFIPLATARSVVLPEGKNKRERWLRIATEAAKQSRRVGVMRIEELMPLDSLVKQLRAASVRESSATESPSATPCQESAAWFMATEVPDALRIEDAVSAARSISALTICVGPEGGWTEAEVAAFTEAGVTGVRLGASILRIETAAIAVGAVVSSFLSGATA